MLNKKNSNFFTKLPDASEKKVAAVTEQLRLYLKDFYQHNKPVKKSNREDNFLVEKIDVDKVEELFKAGADPNIIWNEDNGNTLLHIIVNCFNENGYNKQEVKCRVKFLNILLRHDADVNAKNKHQQTPLIVYSEFSFYDSSQKLILKKLLEHDSDPNVVDNDEDTPLHLIMTDFIHNEAEGDTNVLEELQKVASILISFGANIYQKNEDGYDVIESLQKQTLEKFQSIVDDEKGIVKEKLSELQKKIIEFLPREDKRIKINAVRENKQLKRKIETMEERLSFLEALFKGHKIPHLEKATNTIAKVDEENARQQLTQECLTQDFPDKCTPSSM